MTKQISNIYDVKARPLKKKQGFNPIWNKKRRVNKTHRASKCVSINPLLLNEE